MTAVGINNPVRKFVATDRAIEKWEDIRPYFEDLLGREISSLQELLNWFKDRAELEAIISEDLGWRYIKMTCFTENKEYAERYQNFVQYIQPEIAPFSDKLNKKVIETGFIEDIQQRDGYAIMLREIRKDIDIFREENIPLFTELQTEAQKYSQISGAMMVTIDGKEMTLQQAAVFLQSVERKVREEVYHEIAGRRLKDKETLHDLYAGMIELRQKVAENAGFDNFRDYMFKAMGRFDYTPRECFDFHQSVENEVVPLLNTLAEKRKDQLGVEELRPWDKAVDVSGKEALKPFKGADDLTEKAIECFRRLDPFFGECLEIMREMGHLDLESRKGKAPGGYNYPLAEIGVPFIFMNATSTFRDMITMLHEGGHAVHSFLTRDLELTDFKSTPSEVAELASMSMELITMDHWDVFFDKADDLKRAKKEHLEQIIETLPWVALIDKFQHWVYEHAYASKEERIKAWNTIFDEFSDSVTHWQGLQENKDYLWQKQLHLFEVPFYYIEYGMAQLGAIAVWREYRKDKKKGLEGYKKALKLGYTKSIPEIYAAANIKFDFSAAYIRELMGFLQEEMERNM